jgi:hypothetical protein
VNLPWNLKQPRVRLDVAVGHRTGTGEGDMKIEKIVESPSGMVIIETVGTNQLPRLRIH